MKAYANNDGTVWKTKCICCDLDDVLERLKRVYLADTRAFPVEGSVSDRHVSFYGK
jgi:hypothetical protein